MHEGHFLMIGFPLAIVCGGEVLLSSPRNSGLDIENQLQIFELLRFVTPL
jgi:hypothetical protein